MAKKKGAKDIVKEVRTSEGNFFSIYNEDDDFSDQEEADRFAEPTEACSQTKIYGSKNKETDPKDKETDPKEKETDPKEKETDPKDKETYPNDAETLIDYRNTSHISEASQSKTKKRKTPKEVRQAEPKPKLRSNPRAHQNWNERYLTLKKKS